MSDMIVVEGVGKRFKRRGAERPLTWQEAVIRGWRQRRKRDDFWALQDVSLRIGVGEMVGLIGHNGAGKSTLLRLIGGVGRPEQGQIETQGRIGALLDLGAGFHPDLTGRENVFISGVVAGLTRQEVADRFEAIVAFAELAEFIENPVRTYSSGMWMRLAFAVAAHIDPDILLIDEVLAVGDVAFQQKCIDRIAEFKAQGCTIVFVSHDAQLVERLCDRVAWFQQGQLMAYGEAAKVVGQYLASMQAATRDKTPATYPDQVTAAGQTLRVNENRFGSMGMRITAVRLTSSDSDVNNLKQGDGLHIEISYEAPEPIESPIFGVALVHEDGTICYDTSTATLPEPLPTLQGVGQVTLQIERLDLAGGRYFCDVGVYEQAWAHAYDYHWHVYTFTMVDTGAEKGVLRPPHQWLFT